MDEQALAELLGIERPQQPQRDLVDDYVRDMDDLPAEYPATDQEDESKYHDFANALLEERHEALAGDRAVWWQNMLFAEGHQWWEFDDGEYLFQGGPKWMTYPVRNLIHPYMRAIMAKLTRNQPQCKALPATSDAEDIAAARLADKVLEAKWRELNQPARIRDLVAWTTVTGSAWAMPFWNTDTGRMVPLMVEETVTMLDPTTGMPVQQTIQVPADENGDAIMNGPLYDMEAEPAYVDEGDIALRIFGPHRVFPDRSAQTEADIRSVVIAHPMEIRDIADRWPQMRGQAISADDSLLDDLGDIPSFIDSDRPGQDVSRTLNSTRGAGERATVLFYYERPSREFPHGRSWASVSGRLLEEPGPLPDGLWPVVFLIKDTDIPGRLLGKANMSAGIGPQREFNRNTQTIYHHHRLFMKGVWLLPKSAAIAKGSFDLKNPGRAVEYQGIQKPEMVDLKPLPHKVYEERAMVREQFNSILGVHGPSMGQAEKGVTAGRALLALQEADDSDLGPLTAQLELLVARIGGHFLKLIQMHYEEERTINYIGRNHIYEYAAFRGADLSGVADVVSVPDSAYPWSKSAVMTHTLEIMERLPTLFLHPETGMLDNDRVRRALSLGVEDAMVDQGYERDFAEVQREHLKFELWEPMSIEEMMQPPAVPQIWQNHLAHIQQHADFMKETKFEAWSPPKRHAMIAHLLAHRAMLLGEQTPGQGSAEDESKSDGPASSGSPAKSQGLPPMQGPVLHSSETQNPQAQP